MGKSRDNVTRFEDARAVGIMTRGRHVLIVDDQSTGRNILKQIVSSIEEYPIVIVERDSAEAALEWLSDQTPDLIITDYMMPGKNGDEMVREIRNQEKLHTIPIVMVSAATDLDVRQRSLDAGVTAFLTRPIDTISCKTQCINLLKMRDQSLVIEDRSNWFIRQLDIAQGQLGQNDQQTVNTLLNLMISRHTTVIDHIKRISILTAGIARNMGLNEKDVAILSTVAPLCDIGCISIKDSLIEKLDPLTRDEITQMERHTVIGADILSQHRSKALQMASLIARYHHERWDGDGYPDGLSGEEIPKYARIVSVADVYSSLLSHRPYRPAWAEARALSYMQRSAGKLFDPECVSALMDFLSEDEDDREHFGTL